MDIPNYVQIPKPRATFPKVFHLFLNDTEKVILLINKKIIK